MAGFEPAKPLGRLFEGQPALPFAYTPACVGVRQERPDSNGHVSHRRERRVGACRIAFMLRPYRRSARGETRTLNQRGLSPPPLPAWATRAERDARGGSRTRTESLFERATSAVWVTRALLRSDTGGGIRTPKSRLLTTVCQPIAPLPLKSAGGGTRTLTGHSSPRRSQRRAFAITPHQQAAPRRLRGKESNPHDLFQRQASSL